MDSGKYKYIHIYVIEFCNYIYMHLASVQSHVYFMTIDTHACMYSSSIQLAFTLVLSLVMQESASPHARTEGVTNYTAGMDHASLISTDVYTHCSP